MGTDAEGSTIRVTVRDTGRDMTDAELARTSFECPVPKQRVSATFVTSPESGRPADEMACPRFGEGRVTCAKGCLEPAVVGWLPSPMVPPYCLLSGETASR